MERRDRARRDAAAAREANERYPADPQPIVARHLRAFLDDTADADFSVRTISPRAAPTASSSWTPGHARSR
jgi:hypothetical protein